ncbi:MAG TPA: hypothetical protein VGF45_24865 [Polyangia bacterium]
MAVLAINTLASPSQAAEPFPSFEEWKRDNQVSKELAIAVEPLGPAVADKPFSILVAIKNVSKKRVLFSFGAGWVHMVTWRSAKPQAFGSGSAGSNSLGTLHGPVFGQPFCHPPGTVFGLAPGATLYRHEEFPLTGFPQGPMVLTVFTRLLKVSPGKNCAPVKYHHAQGETSVQIREF